MAPRTTYANIADGLQPLSLWDQSLADAGNLGVIPCTAAGTNAIILTPITTVFAPTVAIPQSLQAFSFVAAASSTGAVTIQIGTTAALKLYRMDGVTQASTGDITATVTYLVNYNAALNSSAGGFQILAPISNEINPIISGATISNSTLSGCTITTSTYNGNTWTAGTGILTIAALKTLTASNTLTFTGTDGTSFAYPPTSDTVVTLTATQTLTNKTLTNPTLTTPTLGVATATTLNGNTFTTGTYTLTGTAAKTLTFNNSLTLAGTDATTITFQASDTYVGRATTDTLTNKTFDTAGAGNVFKINGTAITANTGTGSNVLATSPVLVTPTLGAATATSVTFSPTTGGMVGTTTNDNASAGTVGEYVEGILAQASATALTTATPKTITSLSLTAGDWDVDGVVDFVPTATTNITILNSSVSLTTNTTDNTAGRSSQSVYAPFVPGNFLMTGNIPPVRFSVSATTSVFLVGTGTFTASTLTAFGIIRARRVR